MASGLFSRLNLSEKGLNASEALQKLYSTGIQQDINLFAFSSRLRSSIKSPNPDESNEIYGLVNESLTDSSGKSIPRTKFVTQSYTFSDGNIVWVDRGIGSLKVSGPGSIVNLSVTGVGTQYGVRDVDGLDLYYPATIRVNLKGLVSGSTDAVAELTVNQDRTLSRTAKIISGGTNYVDGELLEPIPVLQTSEGLIRDGEWDPETTRLILTENGENYLQTEGEIAILAQVPGDKFYHLVYDNNVIGYTATLKNEKYFYTVKSASQTGFFLYDEKESEWVYLGEQYDSIQLIPQISPELIQLSRSDTLTSDSLAQLYLLNGRSFFFSYDEFYESGLSLSNNISSISSTVQGIKTDLETFIQNVKFQNADDSLGFPYNSLSGTNIQSDYRVIFRDPDSVLDGFEFSQLRDLVSGKDQNQINGENIPGIWLFTGEKYQRIFSSDDKPFFSQSGFNFLSPVIKDFDGNDQTVNQFSIGTGYYKPGAPKNNAYVKGFDTQLGTLVQNLSTDVNNGGFVYYRQLTPLTVRNSVESLDLFAYVDLNQVKSARVLVFNPD